MELEGASKTNEKGDCPLRKLMDAHASAVQLLKPATRLVGVLQNLIQKRPEEYVSTLFDELIFEHIDELRAELKSCETHVAMLTQELASVETLAAAAPAKKGPRKKRSSANDTTLAKSLALPSSPLENPAFAPFSFMKCAVPLNGRSL